MSAERELRELVEKLQAELAEARAAQQASAADAARLAQRLEGEQVRSDQATAELEASRKQAREADAAFEHVVKRLTEAQQAPKEPRGAKEELAARRALTPSPLANHGIAPDKLELRVRFVFGALFGLVGGTLASLQLDFRYGAGALEYSALIAGAAVTCGFLARHYGDRFWLRKGR